MKTFIIAEAGSCHEGSLNNARRLVDLAYRAGADAVKFQYCSNPLKLARKRQVEYRPIPWSIQREWISKLVECCDDRIEFMCTTYLTEDIEVVAPYVKRFKVSNFEHEDLEFLRAHEKYGKEVLISGYNLHCVSKYPCPDNEAELWKIGRSNFFESNFFIGLSDHTKNPLSGALAVALGADYIETHFRLNDTSPNCPDYCVARSPEELDRYIRNIREAEVLLEGNNN